MELLAIAESCSLLLFLLLLPPRPTIESLIPRLDNIIPPLSPNPPRTETPPPSQRNKMYQPTPQNTTSTSTSTTAQSQSQPHLTRTPTPTLAPTPPPRPSSHQSGPIAHHWNDLPASLLPKPYSASASRSTSPHPHPQPPQPPPPPPPDTETLLEPLIEKLFTAQSTIPDAQRRQLKEKVLRAVPSMSAEQRGEVVGILSRWDGGGGGSGGKKEGREEVVGFMVRERGVAGWAMCLRRGFEGLVQVVE